MGVIATRTGVGAGDFETFIPGMQAYFDMVDKGGVNGRKLVLAYNLDDGGNPTTFSQLSHTLIEQDHAFAAFISTFWFSPNLFVADQDTHLRVQRERQLGRTGNLFAAGGSIQDYHALAAPVAYLVKKTHASSVALISYGQGIPGSYPACTTPGPDLSKGGIKVSYADFDASLGGASPRPCSRWSKPRIELRGDLHGGLGQHHAGPGHPAVRAQDPPAVAERLRPGPPRSVQLPHAGRLRGRQRICPVRRGRRLPRCLPRPGALPVGHEDLRA